MKRLSFASLVAAAIACGTGSSGSRLRLQFSSSNAIDGSSSQLQMQAGETTTIVLMAVGADGPVTFSGSDFPPFASLQGPLLTLAPGRPDAGSYTLRFVAQSGQESANAVLSLEVSRFNTPPDAELWSMAEGASGMGQPGFAERDPMVGTCPGPQSCTVLYPWLYFFLSDAEGDGISVEVEVVPRGHPFTKAPTFSAHVDGSYPGYAASHSAGLFLPMFGLTPEISYDFAYRVRDDFGAISGYRGHYPGVVSGPDGWILSPLFGFDQGPCTTRQCACLPSTSPYGVHPRCQLDLDCCSGVCDAATSTCD